MNKYQQKEKLIPPASVWITGNGGFECTGDSETIKGLFCTDAELSNIDPRLPHAMRMICSEHGSIDSPKISEITLLLGSHLFINDHLGRPIGIYYINSYTILENTLSVHGYTFVYTEHTIDGVSEKVILPEGCAIDSTYGHLVEIDKCYLDKQYPGWEQRLFVAKSLEMNAEDALIFSCGNTNQVNASTTLPEDISFS